MMAILSSLGDVCETVVTTPTPSMVGTTEDAFQSYLHEMRRFGRLTPAEEIELAQRVAAGDEWARHQLIEIWTFITIVLERPGKLDQHRPQLTGFHQRIDSFAKGLFILIP